MSNASNLQTIDIWQHKAGTAIRPFLLFIALVAFGLGSPPLARADTVPVAVELHGLRNDRGDVLLALCSAEMFETARCETSLRVPAVQAGASLHLKAPSPGRYALKVLHDENGNGTLDTGLFGIPNEGYGFSNNPPKRPGRPSFAEAAFEIGTKPVSLVIDVIYWL